MSLVDLALSAYHKLPIEDRRQFNLSGHCISHLYLIELPKVDTKPFGKLVVIAVPDRPDTKVYDQIDVTSTEVKFDYDKYWQSSRDDRKRMCLEAIHEGALRAARQWKWDESAFQAAYRGCLEKGLVLRAFWRKPKTSPNRKMVAQLFFDHDPERIEIEIVILDAKSRLELGRLGVVTTPTHWMEMYDWAGTLKWQGNDTIILTPRRGEKRVYHLKELLPERFR